MGRGRYNIPLALYNLILMKLHELGVEHGKVTSFTSGELGKVRAVQQPVSQICDNYIVKTPGLVITRF